MVWSPVERDLRSAGRLHIAGVDEVGRGPLAGPVVACAVIMHPDAPHIRGVDDSKAIRAELRRELAVKIHQRAIAVSLGAASVREIDLLNIHQATILAMRRALRRLSVPPDHIIVDGRPIRELEYQHTAVVDGDALCYSISCASIIAKVTRDRLMASLAKRYPAYLWERNAGYSTQAHLDALATAGVTIHHRKSFAPVQCLIR